MIGGNDDDLEVLEVLKNANAQSINFCEGKEVEFGSGGVCFRHLADIDAGSQHVRS